MRTPDAHMHMRAARPVCTIKVLLCNHGDVPWLAQPAEAAACNGPCARQSSSTTATLAIHPHDCHPASRPPCRSLHCLHPCSCTASVRAPATDAPYLISVYRCTCPPALLTAVRACTGWLQRRLALDRPWLRSFKAHTPSCRREREGTASNSFIKGAASTLTA